MLRNVAAPFGGQVRPFAGTQRAAAVLPSHGVIADDAGESP